MDGEIEWAAVEKKASAFFSRAAESVEQALRQRYVHENGRMLRRGCADVFMLAMSMHLTMHHSMLNRFADLRCHQVEAGLRRLC